ncbi:hypothetical protein [Gemmata sp.]|uniref:hypothetical protein n=1 Tax=Gemmata sp. TaxID=1914242 RepID=UPI003F706C25
MTRPPLVLLAIALAAGCGKKPPTSDAKTGPPAAGPGAKAGGDLPRGTPVPTPTGRVFSSPVVADVKAARDAPGRKVAIGNVKVTLPEKPGGRAQYDIDYWVFEPPTGNKILRCHITAASGELGSVDIPAEAGKGGHVVGYNVVSPEFRPPFTVKVDEFDFLVGRNGAAQVSNLIEVR